MMRHPIRTIILGCALASVAGIAAAKPSEISGAGSVAKAGAFTQAFTFATASDYNPGKGIIYVSGLDSLFSNLQLNIQTVSGANLTGFINGTDAGGIWKSTFSDSVSPVNLATSTTYKLLVSGVAKADGASFNLKGAYLQPGSQFTAVPVPEPETYAMLLAGLGLMGGIARRRMKSH